MPTLFARLALGDSLLRLLLLASLLMLAACATTGPAGSDERLRLQAESAYLNAEDKALLLYLELTASPQAQAIDWFRLGNLYAQNSELEAAADSYREALRRDPEHARARHNLGMTYLQLGVDAILTARRHLPEVDAEAAGSMRWLACVMEMFMGFADSPICRPAPE